MKTRRLSSTRGAALLTAIILATAVGIIVAHILSTSMSEKNLTARAIARIQADNVAEMAVDYGLSEIASRFVEDSTFAVDEFSPLLRPLVLRDEFRDELKGAGIDLDSLFLAGGKFSKPVRYYVDPDDPANAFDPHKGMNVYVRTADLYGRSTYVHPRFGNYNSYARLTIQVRDAPIFAYAIFYNMDLEFHPGPQMTLYGNVHSNGTIWLNESGGLNFEGVMTAHEDIRVGLMRKGHQLVWTTGHDGSRVHFRNADGKLQGLHKGKGKAKNELASYYTSLSPDSDFEDLGYENWREYAINEFGGNLQSGVHGVPLANPSGVRPYVPDENGATQKENHGYSLIEPNLPMASPYHKGEAEREKFARKAGLMIRVHRDKNGDGIDDERLSALPTQSVRLRRRVEIDEGWSSAAREFLTYYEETDDADEAADPVKVAEDAPDHPSLYDTGYYLSFAMLKRVTQRDPMSALDLKTSTITVTGPSGDPLSIKIDEVSEVPLALNDDFDFDQSDTSYEGPGDVLRAQFDEAFAAHPFMYEVETGIDHNGDGDKKDFVAGMIDRRINHTNSTVNGPARLDLVEVNLAALANILEDEDHTLFEEYTPEEFFNGVVYVEFPLNYGVLPRARDKILRSYEKVGLILTQAGGDDPAVGRVPNPAYNKIGNREEGFTLATNAPLYNRGHFNADGKWSTPSGPPPNMGSDDPANPDPPVALAADAITVLSGKWKFEDSMKNKPGAEKTEFCAALLTGILPTNQAGRSVISGGNHNFPRFLENWGGDTLRFRGAMTCAFESEIQADEASTAYYSPPKRDWGYFDRFEKGVMPPGTPSYPSYRKSSFEFLTAEEFEAAIDALPWSVTLPALP